MKASAFDYRRAETLRQASEWLGAHPGARVIAGGQSLVATMNLRLSAPPMLIDIAHVAELRGVSVDGARLRIGALTRHAELLRDPLVARHAPLLTQAVAHVAHPAIRNRGTLGGNLAHADPASELPACMLALEAVLVAHGPRGERRIAARDFFQGVFETALAADEILAAVDIPAARPQQRFAFAELARRSGDYAIVGLAACADVAGDALSDLRLAYFAVGDRPTLATSAANAVMQGADIAAAQALLANDLSPQDDLQASAATRLHLARVLLKRCVATLRGQSTGGGA